MKVNSAEPWHCVPTRELFNSVLGFIDFLRRSLETISIEEQMEIKSRLAQLIAWKDMVAHLFDNSSDKETDLRKKVLKNSCDNFVDNIEIKYSAPVIFTAHFAGRAMKVLQDPKLYKTIIKEDSYSAEGRFDDSNDEAKCNFDDIPQKLVNFRELEVSTGYVIDRCLRRVEREHENREIFTATAVKTLATGQILPDTPQSAGDISDAEMIVKRVGKIKDNDLMNVALRREFKAQFILTQLNHPNINPLVAYYEDDANIYSVAKSAGKCDLMDLLSNYVAKFGSGIPENVVKSLLNGAAKGLSVAHNVGIAHRDVSLENIVLNENVQGGKHAEKMPNSPKPVQIIDWGHCVGLKLIDEVQGLYCSTCYEGPIGKVRYMSPELVLLQKELEKNSTVKYDAMAADVFGFGVCAFSMLVGQMPFEVVLDKRGMLLKGGVKKLLKALRVNNLSFEAVDFLERTLAWEAEKRMTINEIVQHPFFTC